MRTVPPLTADQTVFLAALAAWSGRPFDEFPSAAPPCNALGAPAEDRILAAIFVGIASIDTPDMVALRLDRLHELGKIHERHYLLALAGDHGAATALADYRAMIDVIRSWFLSLYETAMQVSA